MNQAISKILTKRHVYTHTHTPSHIIIIIFFVKQADKNSNITYSMKERGDYTKLKLPLLDKPHLLKKAMHILVIAFKIYLEA